MACPGKWETWTKTCGLPFLSNFERYLFVNHPTCFGKPVAPSQQGMRNGKDPEKIGIRPMVSFLRESPKPVHSQHPDLLSFPFAAFTNPVTLPIMEADDRNLEESFLFEGPQEVHFHSSNFPLGHPI